MFKFNLSTTYFILFSGLLLISCNGSGESLPLLETQEVSEALNNPDNNKLLSHQEEVQAFYGARSNEPFWTSDELREDFLDEISRAKNDGLDPTDYHQEQLQELLKNAHDSREDQAIYEVLLSDAFFKLAHDLYYGKLDPEKLHWIWDVERESRDFGQLLQTLEESGDSKKLFAELRPQHEVYSGLVRSLAEQRKSLESMEENLNTIPPGDAIEPGDEDDRIPEIAIRLQQLGLLDDDYKVEGNTYSPDLVMAVEKFQESLNIATDGIIGNNTLKELNMSQEDRYNQILVNLERWRWYPRDLGQHYILINIPQYKLAVIKNGDTIRSHNVIAGTKQRQTPIFSDELDHIVVNPTWTLPPTIKAEDVLPKAANDPSYFSKNNMIVSSSEGQSVDPSSIDWTSAEAQNYTITQRPGPTNPLGRVKIMYPNQYSIYLHDTPGQSLFDQSQRAASSGCVRVEGAMDLASYVVGNGIDSSENELEELLASGETTNLNIGEPIKVYHFYWTAWREGGKTHYTEDVYDMDQTIVEALNSNT